MNVFGEVFPDRVLGAKGDERLLVALAFVAFAAWEWWIGKPDPLQYRALSVTFIIAALGLQLKVTSEFLYPIAVAVSVITAFSPGRRSMSSDRSPSA